MTTEIPTRVIIDCSSGEATIVPLTADEIAEREAQALEAEAQRLADEAAAAQKAADKQAGIDALKALGLTDAQITALLS
jgi:Holliday junction resolvasome RuvABC DNA-binding subunit